MVNRVDGAILGIGVVVLVASIIGVVLYDEGGGTTFTISWAEETTELDERSESGSPGEFMFKVPVNGSLIASTTFEVEVAANGPQVNDDSVDVSVSGPQGQSGSCSFSVSATGGGGNACEATVEVNERPEGFSVSAANRTAAEQEAREMVANDNGTGTWTVTVTIDGGTEIQEPNYDVTLTPSVTEWAPQAQLPSTGPGPG